MHNQVLATLLVVKCSSLKGTLVKTEVGAAEHAPSASGDLFEVPHLRTIKL